MRGFDTMTVPALALDGRRVQGSRALGELQPDPPLFPADPRHRRLVEQAERRGEELQDAARRTCLYAARRDMQTFTKVYRDPRAPARAVQRLARPAVIRLSAAAHRATARAVEDDIAELPRRLDEIDAWIAQGVLGDDLPNAADFQIAPNVALLLRFEDLEPLFSGRPSVRLAHRLAPRFPCSQQVALRGTLPASDRDRAQVAAATSASEALAAARTGRRGNGRPPPP